MFKKLFCSDSKSALPLGIFIVPVLLFLTVGIPFVPRYPIAITIVLVSFIIVFLITGFCYAYRGFKIDRYVQQHDFPLWKKTKIHSYRERREAAIKIRLLASQTPCLEKSRRHIEKIIFILFSLWTLLFLGCFSFILLSALSD